MKAYGPWIRGKLVYDPLKSELLWESRVYERLELSPSECWKVWYKDIVYKTPGGKYFIVREQYDKTFWTRKLRLTDVQLVTYEKPEHLASELLEKGIDIKELAPEFGLQGA